MTTTSASRSKAFRPLRLALTAAVAFGALLLGGACSGDGSGSTGPSNSIVVSVAPASGALTVGASMQLAAAVAGTSATAVTWRSSSDGVATVDGSGRVTGTSVGTATITATSQADPSRSGSAAITVVAAPTPISVAVSPTSANLVVGATQQFAAAVAGTANTSVSWSSNAPAVATVDAGGRVTAIGAGTATITATSAADATRSASATVIVTQPIRVTLNLTTLSVDAGSSTQLAATVSGTTNQAVTWTSASPAIATVDGTGRVAGVAAGTASITATSVVDPTQSATAQVVVAPVVAVAIVPGTTSLQVGTTALIRATVTGSTNTGVTWQSSAPSVATIDAAGMVTGVSVGTTTITATSAADSRRSATVSISVVPANVVPTPVVSVTVSPTAASLAPSQTSQLTATVAGTTNTAVTWSSSAPTVATVDANGRVTAIGAGSATITATSAADATKSASAAVTVTQPTVVSVSVSPSTASLTPSQTSQLTATVTGGANTSVTWTTSASGVATVSPTGLVTAVAAGTATITATSVADPSRSANAQISVSVPGAQVGGMRLSAPTTLPTGQSTTVTAQLLDAQGNPVAVAGVRIAWSTLDDCYVSPASSVTDASGRATTMFTAGLQTGDRWIQAQAPGAGAFVVVQLTQGAFTSMTVTPASATVLVGLTRQLTVAIDGTGNPPPNPVWSSSANGIATVDQTGRVTAVSPGSATISVTSSGVTATSAITVAPRDVAGVTVAMSQGTPIASGSTATATAQVTDAVGNALSVAGRTINWTHTDPTGTVTPASSTTDANGRATTMYRAGSAGTWTVRATEPASGPSVGSAQVTVFVAGAPSATTTSAVLGHAEPNDWVTLTGIVNPNSLATTFWFEFSTDASFATGTASRTQSIQAGTSPVQVGLMLGGFYGPVLYGPDTTYFRIVAQNSAGTTRGGAVFVTTPDAPTNVQVTHGDEDRATISWSHNGAVNPGFVVVRRDLTGTSPTVAITAPTTTEGSFIPWNIRSVVDDSYDVQVAHTWAYDVRARNPAGSKVTTVQVTLPRLEPPSALVITARTPTSVTLSWTDNSPTETGFTIERRDTPTGPWTVVGTTTRNVTTFSNQGLTTLNQYSFRVLAFVRSINGIGTRSSVASSEIVVVPQ